MVNSLYKFIITLIYFIVVCFSPQKIFSQKIIDNSADKIQLLNSSCFIDSTNNKSFSEIYSDFQNQNFNQFHREQFYFDFTNHTIWIHFSLKQSNSYIEQYFLEIENSTINRLQLMVMLDSMVRFTNETGDAYKYKVREINSNYFAYKLNIQPDKTYDIFIKIQPENDVMNIPINIYSDSCYYDRTSIKRLHYGIFYGICISILILSVLYFILKLSDSSSIYFILYIIFVSVFSFHLDGLAFQFLWPNFPWINDKAFLVLLQAAFFSFLSYARIYLNLKILYPFLDKAYKFLALAMLVQIILILFQVLRYNLLVQIFIYSTYISFAGLILGIISTYKDLRILASFFSITFLPLIIGAAAIIISIKNGNLELSTRDLVVKIGIAFQMILLLIAQTTKLKSILVNANQNIKRNEEQLRKIFENSSIGISLIDSKGNLENSNSKWHSIFQDINLYVDEKPTSVKQIILESCKTKSYNQFELKAKDANNNNISIDLNCNPILSDNGELENIVVFAEDITLIKEAQSKSTYFENVLVQSPLVILQFELIPNDVVYRFISNNVSQWGYDSYDFLSGKISPKDIIYEEDIDSTFEVFEKAVKSGVKDFMVGFRLYTSKREIRWIEQQTLVEQKDSKVILHGIAIDITETKEIRSELFQSKVIHELLTDNMQDVVWKLDFNLAINYITPSVKEFLGFEQKDLLNNSLQKLLSKESFNLLKQTLKSDLEKIKNNVEIQELNNYSIEVEYITNEGVGKWTELKTFFIFDKHANTFIGIGGVSRDISPHRYAELEMRKQTVFLESIIENIPNPVYYKSLNGQYLGCNTAYEKLIGISKDKIIGKKITDITNSETANSIIKRDNELIAKGKIQQYELKLRSHKKEYCDIVEYKSLYDNPHSNTKGIIGVIVDITERKQIQNTLIENENRLKLILNNAAIGISIHDREGKYVQVNPAWIEIFGYTESEAYSLTQYDLLPEEDQFETKEHINDILTGSIDHLRAEKRFIKKNNNVFWADLTVSSVPNTAGLPKYFIATIIDITEKKAASIELKYKLKYEALITKISNEIVKKSADEIDLGINYALKELGKFTNADRSYVFIFDFEKRTMSNTHEWCDKGITSYIDTLQNINLDEAKWWEGIINSNNCIIYSDINDIPPEGEQEKMMLLEQQIKSILVAPINFGEGIIGFIGLDSVKEKVIWRYDTKSLIRIAGEILAYSFERQKTEIQLRKRVKRELLKREKQQQLLLRKSKLEDLGKLAAGMAHEINQPLGAISMSLDNILFKSRNSDFSKQYLVKKINSMFEHISRIKEFIEHIRLFSRDQSIKIADSEIDVKIVIENALTVIREQYVNYGIELICNFDNKNLIVVGNKFRLEQVILNLLINSKDSISEKKKSNQEDFKGRIVIDTKLIGENVLIQISDNGIGLLDENSDIFEPFFTTKEEELGTGIGLSIAYGIIKEMNGEIKYETKKSEFMRMQILIPYAKTISG